MCYSPRVNEYDLLYLTSISQMASQLEAADPMENLSEDEWEYEYDLSSTEVNTAPYPQRVAQC